MQIISNRQSYDSLYPNHKSWYDDKKFIVIDKNFEMMEKELLGKFKENLNSNFNLKVSKNVQHVDDLNKDNIKINSMNFESIHKINLDTVEFKDKYVDNYLSSDKPSVTLSDPYNQIFGGR